MPVKIHHTLLYIGEQQKQFTRMNVERKFNMNILIASRKTDTKNRHIRNKMHNSIISYTVHTIHIPQENEKLNYLPSKNFARFYLVFLHNSAPKTITKIAVILDFSSSHYRIYVEEVAAVVLLLLGPQLRSQIPS